MKILFLTDASGARGKERRLIELLKSLDKIENINKEIIIFGDTYFYEEIFELKNVLLNLADKRVTFPNSFGINPFLISSSNLDVANKKVVKNGFDFNNFSKLC